MPPDGEGAHYRSVMTNPYQAPSGRDELRTAPLPEHGLRLLVGVVAINALHSLTIIAMSVTVTGQIEVGQIVRALIEMVLYVQLLRRRAVARDAMVLLWVLGALFAGGSWHGGWTLVHLTVNGVTVGVLTLSRTVRVYLRDPGPA